jgi:hypothetical protein
MRLFDHTGFYGEVEGFVPGLPNAKVGGSFLHVDRSVVLERLAESDVRLSSIAQVPRPES